ncbi:MAG: hypothetical protein LLG04_16675, partial [Parachlamydia sp.]|nr:hypothetical protein [Parachlamydia sp.]
MQLRNLSPERLHANVMNDVNKLANTPGPSKFSSRLKLAGTNLAAIGTGTADALWQLGKLCFVQPLGMILKGGIGIVRIVTWSNFAQKTMDELPTACSMKTTAKKVAILTGAELTSLIAAVGSLVSNKAAKWNANYQANQEVYKKLPIVPAQVPHKPDAVIQQPAAPKQNKDENRNGQQGGSPQQNQQQAGNNNQQQQPAPAVVVQVPAPVVVVPPAAAAQAPVVAAQGQAAQPAAAAQVAIAVQAPVVAAQVPAIAVQAPVVAAQVPALVAQAPVVAVQAPVVAAQVPAVVAQAPVVAAQAPVVAVQAPVVAAQVPA